MGEQLIGCCEETVLVVADIPPVPGWAWLGDCNTAVVSEHLDEAGRQAALDQLQIAWRRNFLRIA